MLALFLPAVFVAAELFHLQLIPLSFLLTIVNSIKGIPLSPSYEMFFTLLIFEILNEAFRDALNFSEDVELCDRLQRFLEEEVGAPPRDRRPGVVVHTVKHAATRFKITLRFCRLHGAESLEKTLFDGFDDVASSLGRGRGNVNDEKTSAPERVAAEWRWVPRAELDAYPLSSPGRKLARFILKNGG
jgi:hypothetical protein